MYTLRSAKLLIKASGRTSLSGMIAWCNALTSNVSLTNTNINDLFVADSLHCTAKQRTGRWYYKHIQYHQPAVSPKQVSYYW